VELTDFNPAVNQGGDPALYETENQAMDPRGLVLDAMRTSAPWMGRTLVDLGCGSGFWLPRYADEVARTIGIEPDPSLVPKARARDPRAEVMCGSAEQVSSPSSSTPPLGPQRRVAANPLPTGGPGTACSAPK
jgi:predicted RNA methylase